MLTRCWRGLRLAPWLIALGLLSACMPHKYAVDNQLSDIVWKNSWVHLPRSMPLPGGQLTYVDPVATKLEEAFPAGIKAPVAIYAHGCGGLGNTEGTHIEILRSAGFVVFAPDFLARPGVAASCPAGPASSNITSMDRFTARVSDITYFLDKVRAMRWVDPQRIVLVGFSEGGMTLLQYPRADVAAIVLLGMHCAYGGVARPPAAPGSVPMLVTFTREDYWLTVEGRFLTQSCSGYRSGDNFVEVILPGTRHDPLTLPEGRAAYDKFIARVLQQ